MVKLRKIITHASGKKTVVETSTTRSPKTRSSKKPKQTTTDPSDVPKAPSDRREFFEKEIQQAERDKEECLKYIPETSFAKHLDVRILHLKSLLNEEDRSKQGKTVVEQSSRRQADESSPPAAKEPKKDKKPAPRLPPPDFARQHDVSPTIIIDLTEDDVLPNATDITPMKVRTKI
jgi:hypothetical protein